MLLGEESNFYQARRFYGGGTMFKRWIVAVSMVVCLFTSAEAQKTYPVTSEQFAYCPEHFDVLYCFLPLFGLRNVVTAGISFSLQETRSLQLNSLLGSETSTLALPSPAAGVAFVFDPATGTSLPSRESFGPILSDRAETIGDHRFHIAFTYQHLGFDSLNGTSLSQFNDVLARSLTVRVDEFTAFLTYGLTSRVDVSAAFPIRTVRLSGNGLGFSVSGGNVLGPFPETEVLSDSGLSDITLRAKGTVWKAEHGGIAAGLDVRTPTGEPLNFLGSGAFGAKPFVIGSWGTTFHHVYIGPHLNVGYQWNGKSVLGGVLLGEEGRLPRVLSYTVGTEVGIHKRATMTLDLVGERLFNAERFYLFNQFNQPTSVQVTTKSINMKDGSVGAKVNLWKTLLLTGNLGIRMDRSGLRARLIPLGGLSYTF
jgi:hypothetical protein